MEDKKKIEEFVCAIEKLANAPIGRNTHAEASNLREKICAALKNLKEST